MRIDKLTSKFQEALADAQSLALGKDNAYIQPEHLLAAMLQQEDGPRALLRITPAHRIRRELVLAHAIRACPRGGRVAAARRAVPRYRRRHFAASC
mgnify:CR=1 FL=1